MFQTTMRLLVDLQFDNPEVFAICKEYSQGKVLPAGWSSGYDNQNKQYFADEVQQPLLPT